LKRLITHERNQKSLNITDNNNNNKEDSIAALFRTTVIERELETSNKIIQNKNSNFLTTSNSRKTQK
jgi:hypothetical protein